MNDLEKKMVAILKVLNSNFNVNNVKAEFEAEATRLDEAIRLKEIIDKANLGLIIKIGGAEAVRDLFDAQLLGVNGIVAPMIESSYALQKYLDAIEKFIPSSQAKEIKFGINIETIVGCQNISKILETQHISRLSTITVGRVDLCLSCGLSRNSINSKKIYYLSEEICEKSKKKGFSTTLGGGIAKEAIPFIKKLHKKNLLDYFETRKIIFNLPQSFSKISAGILLANEFELLWLINKKNYYNTIYKEDDNRIKMLKKRLSLGKKVTKSN